LKTAPKIVRILLAAGYLLFISISFFIGFEPGVKIGNNFISFALEMVKILPIAFILIGLFEVWVKKETVERHLGKDSSYRGYIWSILLAGTTVGGLYVAFPVAYSLFRKGAGLSVIFTYLGAAAICRIPMVIFEASFLGVKFTLIRLITSLSLVIITSVVLGKYLEKKCYQMQKG
jgi:uncharacterized membrane protein YraQ (UPF0718 family)